MSFLMPTVSVVLVGWLVVASCRSAPPSRSNAQEEVLILDTPVPEGARGSRLELEGDKFLVKGKPFSSVQELGNLLAEDRTGKSPKAVTPEPFYLEVPVARNFSSLKELFEILREDRAKPSRGLNTGAKNQTYVKGTENSDVMIFFTN